MGLEDIGVKVEGGYGKALLSEIALLLERLIETGEVGVIDLRALPMGPLGYQTIKEALGEGEVKAEVRALGPT
ncbi:MAG: hydrogenase expression/formation protein, partial [Gammaproteobacteria bacterium]